MNNVSEERPILGISVAAEILKTHPRTLMNYEREELIKPHRTHGKRRLFSRKNLREIDFLQFLTQKKGINLAGVKIILKAMSRAEENNLDLKKYLFPEYKPASLI